MDKKYIILVGDGMGDYPLEELEGKTPLEAARTPNLDRPRPQRAYGSGADRSGGDGTGE